MKLLHRLPVLLIFLISVTGFSQTKPVENILSNPIKVYAFINAKIVESPEKTTENGTLVIRNGKIESVGVSVSIPKDAKIFDLKGKTIYPGFIDPYTTYGIKDEPKPSGPVTPKGPENWNVKIKPEYEAVHDFAPDDKAAEKLRSVGITTVQSVPKTGIIKGFGSVVNLGSGSIESQIILDESAQHTTLKTNQDFWNAPYPNSQMGVIALIRQSFYDAKWYSEKKKAFDKNPKENSAPELNPALEELSEILDEKTSIFMESSDELEALRNSKIASEFGFTPVIIGSGYEFKRLNDIKSTKASFVIPVNFVDAPDIASPEKIWKTTVDELLVWDYMPENPKLLEGKSIEFAFTTKELKDAGKFLTNIRLAVKRGLSEKTALSALTTVPAKLIGVGKITGTIEAGKSANFFVASGNIFNDETTIQQTWIEGEKYDVKPDAENDVRGTWSARIGLSDATLDIKGKSEAPAVSISVNGKTTKFKTAKIDLGRISGTFDGDSLGKTGTSVVSFAKFDNKLAGQLTWADGKTENFSATFTKAFSEEAKKEEKKIVENASFPLTYPFGSYGRSTEEPEQFSSILIKNATVWTSTDQGKLENADVLIEKGKIKKVGKNLSAGKEALTIDGTGKHVTPGLIDAHSHTAVSGSVNEGGQPMTSEVRIEDVINSDDMEIYYQLAGGLTAANIMHGSANAIGGQTQTAKWRWGSNPEKLKFEGAFPGIKFALGENPKRSSSSNSTRYPQTRMGVYEIIRDYFLRAKDYKKELDEYNKSKKGIAPKRDIELEPLVEILEGKRTIQCHSYVQSEILGLLKIGDELGFKVGTFQHVLEGYKVADELAKRGSMASTFSDWWGYKYEVIDAIPYNGPIMDKVGVVVSYNSDSGELARRLNTEAAKAVKYGGLSETDALKFVTLNPAKQLGIDKKVGSLEEGKDADFVIWNGSPLSSFSTADQTWIDGRKYFDKADDLKMRDQIKKMKTALVQKILRTGSMSPSKDPVSKPQPKIDECETVENYDFVLGGVK